VSYTHVNSFEKERAMRALFIALAILLGPVPAAAASDVRVHIGINVPAYPTLQRVPGYPVYYAPSLHANYFFYDGLYWVFDGYDWYASAWYNGPWELVDRYAVPVYVLRVPVRYYRAAPAYFRSWRVDYAPRWDVHWGSTWVERRRDWRDFSLRSAPAPAPLPLYQRQYSGSRYPSFAEQVTIQTRNYRYEPRDTVARQQWRELRTLAAREDRVRERRAETVRSDRRVEREAARAERRVEREAVRAQRRDQVRDRPAPPAHAQAKGWPGKGHERALEGNRPAPPEHAQAKGWPGKGHERALERERAAPVTREREARVARERVAHGPPAHAQGRGRDDDRGRGRDRDDHPGRGRGQDR
jgi:hypothetical protein